MANYSQQQLPESWRPVEGTVNCGDLKSSETTLKMKQRKRWIIVLDA